MKSLIIIILFFSVQGYSQTHTGNWRWVQVGSDSVSSVGLFFADSTAGYFEGMNQRGDPQTQPWNFTTSFYRTLDGGFTWTPITYDGISIDVAKNIAGPTCAPTHNSIFIAGADPNYPYIIRSFDNGDHWDSVKNNSLNLEQFFTMFSEQKGIGIGGTQNYPYLMETTDSGVTFSGHYYDSLFTSSLAASIQLHGVFPDAGEFSSELHGTFVISDNLINDARGLTALITNNGGSSWEEHHTDFPGYPNDTVFGGIQYQRGMPNLWLRPNCGHLNTTIDGLTNDFYRTHPNFNISYCFSTDYGATWGYDTSFARRCAAFYGISPGNIWMTLRDKGTETNPPFPAYKIAHTIDFGKTWDVDTTTLPYASDLGRCDAQAIYFTNANHGWIAAINNGKPYVFIYQPIKNSVHIEHYRIAPKSQLPVYPVPANTHVTINLPDGFTPIEVHLCDMVGRQYSAPYQFINNAVLIDTHELPTGIWLAIIRHTFGTNTSRFIIQK